MFVFVKHEACRGWFFNAWDEKGNARDTDAGRLRARFITEFIDNGRHNAYDNSRQIFPTRSGTKGDNGMSNAERVCKFLDEAKTYYLATAEGDQPRVRPFGTALVYEGKLYIQTGKVKPVSHQTQANQKVEMCAFTEGVWLRVAGTLVRDDRLEAKKHMLDQYPSLQSMYSAEDDNTEVLYLKDATATFSSFTAAPRTVTF